MFGITVNFFRSCWLILGHCRGGFGALEDGDLIVPVIPHSHHAVAEAGIEVISHRLSVRLLMKTAETRSETETRIRGRLAWSIGLGGE